MYELTDGYKAQYKYICCSKTVELNEIFDHFKKHVNKCNFCGNFSSSDMVELWLHIKENHRDDESIQFFLLEFKEKRKKEFFNVKVFFKSGLTTCNRNLANTPYSNAIEAYLQGVNEWLKQLETEFETAIQTRYNLKIIGVPYIPMDRKTILAPLFRLLGIKGDQIAKIQRNPQNEILIHFKSSNTKSQIIKSNIKIFLSDLIDTTSIYNNCSSSVNREIILQ